MVSLSTDLQAVRFSVGEHSLIAGMTSAGLIVPLMRDPNPAGPDVESPPTAEMEDFLRKPCLALVIQADVLDVRVCVLPEGTVHEAGCKMTAMEDWLRFSWEGHPSPEKIALAAVDLASLHYDTWSDFRASMEISDYFERRGMAGEA